MEPLTLDHSDPYWEGTAEKGRGGFLTLRANGARTEKSFASEEKVNKLWSRTTSHARSRKDAESTKT